MKYKLFNISMILLTCLCLLLTFLFKIGDIFFDSIAVLSCVLFLSTYRKAWSEDE